MARTLAGALALALMPSALAFRNTSPFFLFSSADDLDIARIGAHVEIAQAAKLTSHVTDSLKGCQSRTYIVAKQDGVSSADYADRSGAPRLAGYLAQSHRESQIAIPDVVGEVDASSIAKYLQTQCGAELVQFDGPATGGEMGFLLMKTDVFLEDLVNDVANGKDYTVIYTTTPRVEQQTETGLTYEMENAFGGAVQMELKRDLSAHRRASNATKEGALFEKYQFLSPGLFMAFSAMIPLVLILYVGLTAITNLEVSYFAFSKEMGPSAQRKQ
ncbi:hypothetical protein P154DRAFT_609532 [Amniculicola lignicola CBS 123094]|uniref:Protein BIG1 n=1 Tax=Amniculicola lignicola CBS 123094 TaxID=1392246 RepID=A0A6A5W284_9PLEO|nr:hypothetical protein P154DRAFT_609532 [Amniculicola lignicola CBS 123094]